MLHVMLQRVSTLPNTIARSVCGPLHKQRLVIRNWIVLSEYKKATYCVDESEWVRESGK